MGAGQRQRRARDRRDRLRRLRVPPPRADVPPEPHPQPVARPLAHTSFRVPVRICVPLVLLGARIHDGAVRHIDILALRGRRAPAPVLVRERAQRAQRRGARHRARAAQDPQAAPVPHTFALRLPGLLALLALRLRRRRVGRGGPRGRAGGGRGGARAHGRAQALPLAADVAPPAMGRAQPARALRRLPRQAPHAQPRHESLIHSRLVLHCIHIFDIIISHAGAPTLSATPPASSSSSTLIGFHHTSAPDIPHPAFLIPLRTQTLFSLCSLICTFTYMHCYHRNTELE
ncbi:hypothetical protein FB451DRAFT_1281941 [Mycena latifolia]|nr:hypothetical protein FB451DRAFT_1281941 [Mycena latifolia]